MIVRAVVAADLADGIGAGGDLPWRAPADLARFARLTAGKPLIMGRVTFCGIVERRGTPLPGRPHVVLSRSLPPQPAAEVFLERAPDAALACAMRIAERPGAGEVCLVGGAETYRALADHVTHVSLTRVHLRANGTDTSLPTGFLDAFELVSSETLAAAGNPVLEFHEFARPR